MPKPRKPGVPPGRKGIDWEAIEREYRAGVLSGSEIARQHGISEAAVRRRAKIEGWARDLSGKVRAEAQKRLLRASLRDALAPESEKQVIELGAVQMVEVVRRHQRHFGKLAELAEGLTEQALAMVRGRKPSVEVRFGRESISDILQKIAVATSRYVPLERRAYNIDDAGTGEDLASWLKAQTGLD